MYSVEDLETGWMKDDASFLDKAVYAAPLSTDSISYDLVNNTVFGDLGLEDVSRSRVRVNATCYDSECLRDRLNHVISTYGVRPTATTKPKLDQW